MTELTKEQLIEEAKLKIAIAKCHPNSGMARVEGELFKIALASLVAEPLVPVMYKGMKLLTKEGLELIRDGIAEATGLEAMCMADALLSGGAVPSVPKEMYWQDAPVEGSSKAAAYATGWKACREAMLQSGNFRDNKNSSTNNFREIPETSTSSQGTPAGWISCSDAVPAEYCDVILRDDLGNVFPGSWDKVFCPTRGGNKMAFVDKDGVEVESSTHWMPLPESPKVVK